MHFLPFLVTLHYKLITSIWNPSTPDKNGYTCIYEYIRVYTSIWSIYLYILVYTRHIPKTYGKQLYIQVYTVIWHHVSSWRCLYRGTGLWCSSTMIDLFHAWHNIFPRPKSKYTYLCQVEETKNNTQYILVYTRIYHFSHSYLKCWDSRCDAEYRRVTIVLHIILHIL